MSCCLIMKEKVKPGTAARCSTHRRRQVRPGKKADCFTLLRRITNSKASIQTKEKVKPGKAAHCSTQRHRQVRPEKWTAVSLYLDELPIQKCKLRDRFNVSIFSLGRLSRGVHATLTNPGWSTHTCSEVSYRITDVECIVRAKALQLNLTGAVGWPNVRASAK